MDDSRARTLATLDAFLESQRGLLARTQADLHKLVELRERALEDPEDLLENVEDELSDPSFKMSEYFPPRVPEEIDWDLFSSADRKAFSKIPIPGIQSPPKTQQSSPSELQLIVRQAVEDVLGDFHPFEDSEEDDEGAAEAEAANEQRLAELVNLGRDDLPVTSTPIPLQRGRVGSKVRLKRENEVTGTDAKGKGKVDKGSTRLNKKKTANEPVVRLRSQRLRRPTTRADQIYTPLSPVIPSPQPPSTPRLPSPESLPLPDRDATMGDELLSEATSPDSPVPASVSRRPPKQKTKDGVKSGRRSLPSETYNVPWSIAEQHLLEKLLEEIPSGEKNRWAKISRAMSGKRTPRQVASRVQKYFEKLKKFGVEPGT